jgi:undecaprenyl-diphosphatase
MIEKLIQLDKSLFLWLNGFHSPIWDNIMWFISGKLEWIPLYLLLVWYIIYLFKWKSILIILAVILTIILSDQLSVIVFKNVFHRLRPSHAPELQSVIHLVNHYRGGLYGFVSNHAANSFALATFLHLLFRRKMISFGLYTWAVLVSYSRIYIGVHYPADILGGALLGVLIAWGMFSLYRISVSKIYREKK